ncbi:hypothetical protein NHQ30_011544 [Ciborinia camelliae]|nr:hypothetical protein NHQ30_011544 [Ciborinia camelliae]
MSWIIHDLIITPPAIFLRQATPTDCSLAEQSASLASQQAFQEASQSIQQAFQEASQSIQQANQSASEAVQEASQSASNSVQQASQLIAAASRTSSSIVSSASSAIASIHASASSAVISANRAMQSAQFTASLLQQEISRAGATAATANEQDRVPQNSAITATQAALAIIGSIIASTLLTILVFWCIIRYRKMKFEQQRTEIITRQDDYSTDEKQAVPRMTGDGGGNLRKDIYEAQRQKWTSTASSLGSYDSNTKTIRDGEIGPARKPTMKETYLAWNPKDPTKAPTLKSWLQHEVKGAVSPFASGAIKSPTSGNDDEERPLGRQLKSPLNMVPIRIPKIAVFYSLPASNPTTPNRKQIISPRKDQDIDTEPRDEIRDRVESTANTGEESGWTDDMQSTITPEESPLLLQGFKMLFPKSEQPGCNTTE